MSYVFPRTAVAGVSLSRMIIGTNWLLGWSHRSSSADEGIKARYSCADDFFHAARYGNNAIIFRLYGGSDKGLFLCVRTCSRFTGSMCYRYRVGDVYSA